MREELYNVFVYGTLLIGECNHHIAEPYLQKREKGTVKVFLYKVDYYPAVVLDTNGREIEGEWFTVTKEGLEKMDRLDGYNESSHHNEYERVMIQDVHNGKQGFIYTYTSEQVKELELITSVQE